MRTGQPQDEDTVAPETRQRVDGESSVTLPIAPDRLPPSFLPLDPAGCREPPHDH